MSENRLRQRLQAKEISYGMWVTMESPTVTEIASAVGLDWVCVDMEHGHLDFREVMEHIRAARGPHTTVLVRVPAIEQDKVKRVLDMGANGVLLPLVRTAADVALGMCFGRYPPEGIRGVGGERAVKWGLGYDEYLHSANAETLIIPIIETREAAENIDSILAVDGIEALFFGPADLSASYGYLGDWEGPGIAELILDMHQKATLRGIGTGVMSTSHEDGIHRGNQGFSMVGLGSDAALLIRSINQALEKSRGQVVKHLWF